MQGFQLLKEGAGEKDCLDVEDIMNSTERVALDHLESIVREQYGWYFEAIDTNQDGVIQWREFETFFKIIRVDTAQAKESFEAIDTNKDGVLSKDEFIAAAVEFYISKEDTPSKHFMGQLVD